MLVTRSLSGPAPLTPGENVSFEAAAHPLLKPDPVLIEAALQSSLGNVRFEAKQGVAWVTIDSHPVNMLDQNMIDDLNNLFDYFITRDDLKVVVFQSAHPDIFISGFDLRLLASLETVEALAEVRDFLERLAKLPQTTIAVIEGTCRGGGHEFALACDMRFAARGKAVFQSLEVGFGIAPIGGITQRLPRLVGLGRAAEIILGAHDFDADLADRYGSINRALDPEEINPFVEELANRIARFPRNSLFVSKQFMEYSLSHTMEDGLSLEKAQVLETVTSPEAVARFGILNDHDLETFKKWDKLIVDLQYMAR